MSIIKISGFNYHLNYSLMMFTGIFVCDTNSVLANSRLALVVIFAFCTVMFQALFNGMRRSTEMVRAFSTVTFIPSLTWLAILLCWKTIGEALLKCRAKFRDTAIIRTFPTGAMFVRCAIFTKVQETFR